MDIWVQGKPSLPLMDTFDTVGIGNRDNWDFDPYDGFKTETKIDAIRVSDQLGGIVSAVYGAKIMKDLGGSK